MREIYEIVFLSSRSRIELIKGYNGMFGVIKIVDGKENALYSNKDFNEAQKFYNKKIGAN